MLNTDATFESQLKSYSTLNKNGCVEHHKFNLMVTSLLLNIILANR